VFVYLFVLILFRRLRAREYLYTSFLVTQYNIQVVPCMCHIVIHELFISLFSKYYKTLYKSLTGLFLLLFLLLHKLDYFLGAGNTDVVCLKIFNGG